MWTQDDRIAKRDLLMGLPERAVQTIYKYGTLMKNLVSEVKRAKLNNPTAGDIELQPVESPLVEHAPTQSSSTGSQVGVEKMANISHIRSNVVINRQDDGVGNPSTARIPAPMIIESLSRYRIDRSRIFFLGDQVVGRGGMARVHLATLLPSAESNEGAFKEPQTTAVKRLIFDPDTDDRQVIASFAQELSIWAPLDHENIIKLTGFVEDHEQGVAWFVLPWEPNGNLREFILSRDSEPSERVSLLYDVASGLEYLHTRTPPICHGDLKSLNILVDSAHHALITDFGSARVLEPPAVTVVASSETVEQGAPPETVKQEAMELLEADIHGDGNFLTLTGPAWSLRWAAPELLGGVGPSLSSDIWAFGWICWEALTGALPFSDVRSDKMVISRIVQGNLPEIKNTSSFRPVVDLLSICWGLEPLERPSATRCREEMAVISGAYGNCLPGTTRGKGQTALVPAMGTVGDSQASIVQQLSSSSTIALSNATSIQPAQDPSDILASGRIYLLQGKYTEAEELAKVLHDRDGHHLGVAHGLCGLAHVHYFHGRLSDADACFTEAKGIYSALHDLRGVAETVCGLGDIYRLQGAYPKAEGSYIQAQEMYDQIGHRLGVAETLCGLGQLCKTWGLYSRAEASFSTAQDTYTSIGNQVGIVQAMCGLAGVRRLQRQLCAAEKAYHAARDLYSEFSHSVGIGRVMCGIGDIHRQRGMGHQAVQWYQDAQNIFNSIGHPLGVADVCCGLAHVHLSRGQYDDARLCLQRAEEVYGTIRNTVGIAETACGMGDLYRMQGDCLRAEESYRRAQSLYVQAEHEIGVADAISGLGQIRRAQCKDAEAELFFNDAGRLYKGRDYPLGVANVALGIGATHLARLNYEDAALSINKALKTFTRADFPSSRAAALSMLALAYRIAQRDEESELCIGEASEIYHEIEDERGVKDCQELRLRLDCSVGFAPYRASD